MRVFYIASAPILLTILTFECLRTLQQASYFVRRGYFKVVFTKYFLLLVLCDIATAVTLIMLGAESVLSQLVSVATLVTANVVEILAKRKTPLVFTKRIARLVAMVYIVLVAVVHFVPVVFATMLPFVVALSFYITLPVEKVINNHYIRKAKLKLQQSNIKVVAVTGSYGKTSVKEMLAKLLPSVIAPQGSCNTPLGIAKYINNAELNAEYLVLEFGARNVGDIATLCHCFKPIFGIVTGVCAQHLSTFKSVENIIKTKSELISYLPKESFCVLNANDDNVKTFENIGTCKKILSDTVAVGNVSLSADGTSFCVASGGKRVAVHLPFVSLASANNFQMCLALTRCLGISDDKVFANVTSLQQTPHRLEIISTGDFYILDDSYNASEVGAKNCVETLEMLSGGKVAILQGIVECGKDSRKINAKVGEQFGNVCKVVVILGKNAKALAEGVMKTSCKMLFASCLTNAVSVAKEYLQKGDILVFQNDLPDTINL